MSPIDPRPETPMQPRPASGAWRWIWGAMQAGGWLAFLLLISGCAVPFWPKGARTPDYKPDNVFVPAPSLMYDLKRVAVLPLTREERRTDLTDACELLSPILQAELIKTKRFEIIPVDSEILRIRTSRSAWIGTEVMPAAFFDSIRQVYGCDAVLFCQLTYFRAYAPLAIGWRMKLVDVRTRQTLWAVDELVDAGQSSVLNGLDQYQSVELQNLPRGEDTWRLRNSPRQFGQYAAAQIFASLPIR